MQFFQDEQKYFQEQKKVRRGELQEASLNQRAKSAEDATKKKNYEATVLDVTGKQGDKLAENVTGKQSD